MSDLQEDRLSIDITVSSPTVILAFISSVLKQGFKDISARIDADQRAQASTRQMLNRLISDVEDLKRQQRNRA